MKNVARRVVPPLVRNYRLVLAFGALVTLLSVFFSAKLYADLRSDVEELLPPNADSVKAAHSIGPKVHNVTHLSVVLEGDNPDALEKFADDLAVKLRAFPKDMVASVDYRVDEQEAFVHKYGALYIDLPDLNQIASQLDARIAWEKHHAAKQAMDLLGDDDGADDKPPALDFSTIEKKYGDVSSEVSQFRNGYYQTPDGHILAMLVRPPELATGYSANKLLEDKVHEAVESLHPEKYDASLRVGYNGDVSSLVEEQEALIQDLASSTAVVLIFVMLALWLYFRRWSAILAVTGALGCSTAATFGLGYFLVGHLNANTAFLGSIIVGNGINVSIIFVARYLEERRKRVKVAEAVELAWGGTLTATFVASFGAALAYVSLASTDFRGFSQFGLIGGLGMAVCWLGAYTLLPPLLVAVDRNEADVPPPHKSILGSAVANLVGRYKGWVKLGSAALLCASVVGVLGYKGDIIEYDMAKLRSEKSRKSGAVYWGHKVDQVFKKYLTPVIVRADSPEDLDKFAAALDVRRKALGDKDPVREVRTLDNIIPQHQAEKLPVLAHIRDQLTDARLKLLDPATRKKVELIRPPKDLRTVTLADLPESFRLPLVERDGTVGRLALVFPNTMGNIGPRELEAITGIIRGASKDAGVKTMAVGQALLFLDIADAIVRDGPKATLIAFAAVCLLVLVGFRKLRPTLQVLAGLCLGVAWLLGWAAFARVRLNFLNFVVLPITFGIGVDYAANIIQRQRLEGPGSLGRVLRETGGAVALCSCTTIIGYASLLVADSQALAGFGLLASLGEVACLTAALVALPAWMAKGNELLEVAVPEPEPATVPAPETAQAAERETA